MSVIEIFPWNENFNTGIEVIDSQHKELVLIINSLAREIAFGIDQDRLNGVFDRLVDYTHYHFETEEAIWHKYLSGQTLEIEHKHTHAGFVDRVLELKNSGEQAANAEDMLGYLARWLASHILETDRYLAGIVMHIQQGSSVDDAKELAKEDMGGFVRKLIDIILSIYSMLSANTLRLMMEIREHKELEEDLNRQKQELFVASEYQNAIIDNFPFLLWMKDLDGKFLVANELFIKQAGFESLDEIVGKSDFDIWPHDLAQKYVDDDAKVLATLEPISVEEKVVFGDREVYVETYKGVVMVGDEVVGTIGFARDVTQKINAQNKILESKKLLETIVDTLPIRVFWKDKNLVYMGCNQLFANDAGFASASEVVGKTDYDMAWKSEAELYRGDDSAIMQNDEKKLFYEEPQTTPDGKTIWLSTSKVPLKGAKDEIIGVVGTYEDRTAKKEAELKQQLAASVFANAKEGIIITLPDTTIVDVNGAFEEITGYAKGRVVGQKANLLKSGRHDRVFYENMWRVLVRDGVWQGELWNRRIDGSSYAQMTTISAIYDEMGEVKNYIALFSDMTAIKEHEIELEHIAHYDALTGLANRVLLEDRLNQAMIKSARYGGVLAVVYIDLDGFKEINDTLGHEAGDTLLKMVSKNMKSVLREGDTIARLGGDEFVAVLCSLESSDDSVVTLERLLRGVSEEIFIGNRSVSVSASLGVSFYPQAHEVGFDTLLRQADQAMYAAKQEGKNQFKFFDHEQELNIKEQFKNIKEIRSALESGEFELFYQPKVNMRSGEMMGVEALIRWRHPEKGVLAPALFLPFVEGHKIEILIGEWVIWSALRQIEIWSHSGILMPVSVNVGAYQLEQYDFVERLRGILEQFDPSLRPLLEIELLETSALADMKKMASTIQKCKKLGVEFSLDDFGSGYASLAYLKTLPIATLKIDQGFVRDMMHDAQDLAILEGIIALGAAFRKKVIAEGVESVEHGRFLLQLGCEVAQGYAIARPMEASKVLGWKSEWKVFDEWHGCSLVASVRLQLLYAMVEHRSWVGGLEAFVNDTNDSFPPLDARLCRFSEWLYSKEAMACIGKEYHDEIAALHEHIHETGMDIVVAKNANNDVLAREKLAVLAGLKDRLTKMLIALLNQK